MSFKLFGRSLPSASGANLRAKVLYLGNGVYIETQQLKVADSRRVDTRLATTYECEYPSSDERNKVAKLIPGEGLIN